MKKLLFIVAFGSVIHAMQTPQNKSSLALALALEMINNRPTADQAFTGLRQFIQNIPEASDLIKNPYSRKEIIEALIKKTLEAKGSSYDVEKAIDAFDIPELSEWIRKNFSYFNVIETTAKNSKTYPIVLYKQEPTVKDLFQALFEQTGKKGNLAAIEDISTSSIMLSPNHGNMTLKSLGISKGAQFNLVS